MKFVKAVLLILLLSLNCSGCATTSSLPAPLLVKKCDCQPVHKDGIKRIAVLELKSSAGNQEAAEKIMGAFTAKVMSGTHFELMERAQIDKIIQELKLDASGLVDAKTAKEAGKMMGADAVVVGEITNYQVESKPFEYKYSRDKANLLPLPPGEKTASIVGMGEETRTYTVEKYYVSVGFNLRMIAVDTGEIVWSRHVSRSFGMREGEYEIRNVYMLLDQIIDAAVSEAACDLS